MIEKNLLFGSLEIIYKKVSADHECNPSAQKCQEAVSEHQVSVFFQFFLGKFLGMFGVAQLRARQLAFSWTTQVTILKSRSSNKLVWQLSLGALVRNQNWICIPLTKSTRATATVLSPTLIMVPRHAGLAAVFRDRSFHGLMTVGTPRRRVIDNVDGLFQTQGSQTCSIDRSRLPSPC